MKIYNDAKTIKQLLATVCSQGFDRQPRHDTSRKNFHLQ